MKILSVETSGALCGACICENTQIIEKLELNNGLTHSESLMPLLQQLLDKHDYKISDFDAFVCDVGPGSFTGIRIGVATVKAFIDTLSTVQYSGISSLEALAYNVEDEGLICSIIDCKNDNCYFALYNLNNNKYLEIIPPTSASITELIDTLGNYSSFIITFVGDGVFTYKNIITKNLHNAQFLDDCFNIINTEKLAIAGYNRIKSSTPLPLSPLYLKKPQAQRLLELKSKN